MTINHLNLWRFDLNLLVAFDALMNERSVTKAAQRLGLGQPAVSHLLGKLRRVLNDQLFLRGTAGLEPTPLARRLHAGLAPMLDTIETTIARKETFEPRIAQRTFRMAMPDLIEPALMPALLRRARVEAPSITFRTLPFVGAAALDQLDRDTADVAINYFPELPPSLHRMPLLEEVYVCVHNPRLGEAPNTMKKFLARRHIVADPAESRTNRVTEALARLNLHRDIWSRTPNYLTMAYLVSQTDAIATVPLVLFRPLIRLFKLATSKPPFPVPGFVVSMVWHQRWDDDAGSRWFRDLIVEIAPKG